MRTSLRYVDIKCTLLHQRDITERRGGNKKENQSLRWVLSLVRGRLKPKSTDKICLFGANKQPGAKQFICEFMLHKLQKHIYSYYYKNIHICKQQQQDGDDNVVVWTQSIDVTNTESSCPVLVVSVWTTVPDLKLSSASHILSVSFTKWQESFSQPGASLNRDGWTRLLLRLVSSLGPVGQEGWKTPWAAIVLESAAHNPKHWWWQYFCLVSAEKTEKRLV